MDEEKRIAWFCTYTPLEILDAAGLVPIRHFGDPQIVESADTLLHPALCPYARACLAQELREEGPHPAIFVNSCDAMRRLYDAWKDNFADDFIYLMDLPRNPGRRGKELLAREFRHLIEHLGRTWGKVITPEGLRSAGKAREKSRLDYLNSANGACGGKRLRIAMDIHTRPLQERDQVDISGSGEASGVPVLLTGNLLNPAGIVTQLERAGARVVWMDLCNGDRSFASPTLAEGEDLDALLDSLANAYIERHPCARMSDARRRYDLLVDTAQEVGARGVIYASLKFCDSYLYDFPRVEARLKQEGIPVLRLESDYTDGHVGQLLTRVEAFLEMV
jgi:benzoyl-CoA reductase/2-hydroxyglutaryl-CoA dehydratase subunit BcrC/BadD/HgdB